MKDICESRIEKLFDGVSLELPPLTESKIYKHGDTVYYKPLHKNVEVDSYNDKTGEYKITIIQSDGTTGNSRYVKAFDIQGVN